MIHCTGRQDYINSMTISYLGAVQTPPPSPLNTTHHFPQGKNMRPI